MERNKGITLVALIITIVVMLILVAVSVNILIKSNLLGTAEKTVNKYKIASEEEGNNGVIEIDGKKYNSIEDYMKEKKGEKEEKLPDIKAGERATANSNYNGAVIPKGFTVSGISTEQKVDNGLVIYDIPEGTTPDWSNPDSVKTKYNQFVWIPVEVKSTDKENSITDYTEPYSYDTTNNYDQTTGIAGQITELTKSIYKYGGFYIGRYEAGSKTPRTSSSGVTEIGIKQDMYPYIYVKWGDSMSSIGTTGAVYLSNSLYNTNEYGATSMLCTGACWDSMLDFIKDSSHNVTSSNSWGNYYDSDTYKVYRGSLYSNSTWARADTTNGSDVTKDTDILLTTGATERNSSKNIYDVAGNCFEWTTEAYKNCYRVVRGGYYSCTGSYFPVHGRLGTNPAVHNDFFGSFRPLLYVAL